MTNYWCIHGTCNSYTRKNPNIRFVPFPKPTKSRERAEKWVKLMCKPNFTIDQITNNTYICELHFPGETNSGGRNKPDF